MEDVVKNKILIVGGLGYLGARLANYLLSKNFDVFISSSRKDATLPKQLDGSKLLYFDFSNSEQICQNIADINHAVFLASPDFDASKKNPEKSIKFHTEYFYNFLHALSRTSINYFIYVSTSHVYGSQTSLIDEKSLTFPKNTYSYSHKLSEEIILKYFHREELNGAILRASNIFGKPLFDSDSCWKLFVNDVSKQAVLNNKIFINSDPDIVRDFITIDSFILAIHKLISTEMYSSSPIFNLGSGNSSSLYEMASLVKDRVKVCLGKDIEIISKEPNRVNISGNEYVYDSSKLETLLSLKLNHSKYSCIDELIHHVNTAKK